MLAASLNHRDLFVRQALYPGVTFGVPLCADGCGIVVETGSSQAAKQWQGKRVIINPGTGWQSDPEGPEAKGGYKILGGTKVEARGTLAEEIIVDASEVEEAPDFLSHAEAAALPLTGLTAWRACVTKLQSGKSGEGKGNILVTGASGKTGNVLVTGIGGGVALMALKILDGRGVNVWVTSGDEAKLKKAVELGAKGGVNYKDKDWDKKLKGQLPKDRPQLDAIIDGAGGDVVGRAAKLMKVGGIIVSYGMTLGPSMPWMMSAVLQNMELRGSTMGSRQEFKEMVEFCRENGVKPVVSRTVRGLKAPHDWDIEAIDGLFEDMKRASQFGKLVIEIQQDSKSKL